MKKAGVIGAGAIAFGLGTGSWPMTHAASYQALADRVTLTAAAEPDAERRRALRERYPGLAVYEDPAGMLAREKPEVVSLCAPDRLHEDLFQLVLEAGVRGVWCEKPLAMTLAGAQKIADGAKAAGTLVQVNYWRRFVPEIRAIRDRLVSGEFGGVHLLSGYYAETFIHNGSHLFDLVEFFAGAPRPLFARAEGPLNADGDGPVTVFGDTPSGAPFCLRPVPRRRYNIFELDVLCEKARVRIAENGRRVEIFEYRPDSAFPHLRILEPEGRTIRCDWRRAFDLALADLLDGLDAGREPLGGPVPSLATARAIDETRKLI